MKRVRFPNCLCGIITRQLELLPDNPTNRKIPYSFYTAEQYKPIIKVLSPYVNSRATKWHITWNPTASHSMKSFGYTLRRGCWAVISRVIVPNCLVLILHRQLGNYLFGTGENYSLTAQHITISYISQCLTLAKNISPTH